MEKSMTELRSVTCRMGSHSVTCHSTQVSAPRLNPSHAGRYSIYLPRRDGRLSWPCYSETQTPGVELATSRSRIQCPNHWATCVSVKGRRSWRHYMPSSRRWCRLVTFRWAASPRLRRQTCLCASVLRSCLKSLAVRRCRLICLCLILFLCSL